MRFRTRAFLLSFVPFAFLLMGSFWAIQRLVQSTVASGLRASLRDSQVSLSHLQSRNELQRGSFLRVAGENAALKAGVQLLLSYPASTEARQTVEDQLLDLCARMGFDFLMVSDPRGQPLAGVLRDRAGLTPIDGSLPATPQRGLMPLRENVYQIASVPLDQGEENIGSMAVGERFDFSAFSTPAVLLRNGKPLKSSISGIALPEIEAALKQCDSQSECDARLGGQLYVSIPFLSASFGDGYELRSLQNLDSASMPLDAVLHTVFLAALTGALLAALAFSLLSARSMVRPVSAMTSHLQKCQTTGLLPEFQEELSSILEIRELTASFNRAASAIREGRRDLQMAYVEFVGSLANALDARDRYTAGHSGRVSELSCAVAAALGMGARGVEDVRIGALLHDIGKIGISDTVLQKPGKLTCEEFELIKQHPQIGRRILEGVQGLAPYLDAVELHHENWDGSGYPRGQKGEETPLAARIIHVSDAYDAMTSDRPYRQGMTHQRAVSILEENAGSQFDPGVVTTFVALGGTGIFESCDRETRDEKCLTAPVQARQMACAGVL